MLYENSKIIWSFKISCGSKLNLNYLFQSEIINLIFNVQWTNNSCNKQVKLCFGYLKY